MSFSKDSKQKLIAVAAVVIVLLLGLTSYLTYSNFQLEKERAEVTEKLEDANLVKADLEKQYYEALAELEEMRGNNEELNALIDQQQAELKEEKDRIASLIRTGKANKNELANAREQISNMRTQLDQYLVEINKLKEDKQLLTEQNEQLATERDELQTAYSSEREMNEELTVAKAALVSEKESLAEERNMLSKKVNIASVIKVKDIAVTGEKVNSKGKAKKKKRSKSVDRLKVCFTATENEVAEAGVESFFVRIINPRGETIAVEDMGSGITTNKSTEEEIRFTQTKEIDYNQEESNACFYWDPDVNFTPGNYEVEIFNKGYLSGRSTFVLK